MLFQYLRYPVFGRRLKLVLEQMNDRVRFDYLPEQVNWIESDSLTKICRRCLFCISNEEEMRDERLDS